MSMPCKVTDCPRKTLSDYCFIHKPKKPMQAKRPMKKLGRIGRKLVDQRKEYLDAFPGPHYCYYCLYVGIEEELEEKDVQVEHFLTKNNHPGLRFDYSNLVKSCPTHNKLKGGMDGPEFLELLDEGGLTS